MTASDEDHPIRIESNPNRIRVVLGGTIVAETTRALTLREADHPPVFYVPRADVALDLFDRTDRRSRCPYKGQATYYRVTAGGLERRDAAWSYEAPLAAAQEIAGHLAFDPSKVDAIEELY